MFRMTKLTDYGIVLLTHFANHPGQPAWNARELAEETRLPLPTVGKLLKQLSHGNLLVSHRGTKGGYSLARPPLETTVAEIIDVLEGSVSLTECTEPGACDMERQCPVRPNWQVISRTLRGALEGLTLADMARPIPPLWSISPPRPAVPAGPARVALSRSTPS